MLAAKLRGTTRRQQGKQSRNEAFERARRAAPAELCDEAEAAARRSRHSDHDASLASMLEGGLSLRPRSARELCEGLRGSNCIEVCEL